MKMTCLDTLSTGQSCYLQETGAVSMSASVAPSMKEVKDQTLDEEMKHTEVCHVY